MLTQVPGGYQISGAWGELWTAPQPAPRPPVRPPAGPAEPQVEVSVFSGYKSCDGLNCRERVCSIGSGPRIITGDTKYFCPFIGGPLCSSRWICFERMALSELDNRGDVGSCPYPMPQGVQCRP
jgi:hypothetical protein